ncbi:hypothetical protein CapIbe_003300 [Capra ibex]
MPRAAQRPFRRAQGFRPAGLGPAGRNCTRSPHAATNEALRPRPLASPGPTAGLRPLRQPGAEDREKGRAAHPSSFAGPRAQTCGRLVASPAEDPSGKLRGWGSPTAGAEGVSRGSGLSIGAASQVLLDLSGPSRPLQSCHAAANTLRFCAEWTL